MELATDILIVGGGTAGCLAAVAAKEARPDLRVTIMEKAAIERSGCLAAGMNAINAYLHPGETPESFTRFVRYDACGLIREDLVLSAAAEINQVVRRVEAWGLPVVKTPQGEYAARGRWNLKIKGENLKPILAAAVRRAEVEVLERVAVTNLIVEDGRVVGAFGLGVRDGRFHAIRAGAVIISTGGAAGLYRPVNPGSGANLGWYCPFNVGSGYAVGIRAGAEMTGFEMRFIALRTKGILCPTGTLALGFGAKQVNALGEQFMRMRYAHVGGEGAPTCYRIHGPIQEHKAGRGPCCLDTRHLDGARVREVKEAFLDMYPGIVLYWAANGIDPSKQAVEIAGTEPYLVGGHCQAGYWIDACRRTTLPGLYAAGDVAGGYPYKFVSGCWAEGAIAGREAAQAGVAAPPRIDGGLVEAEKERVLRPLLRAADADAPTPAEFLERLQRITDEYAGGSSAFYELHGHKLLVAKEELARLARQTEFVAARDGHELLAAHEAFDRLLVARVMVEHLLYREETRWPGFQTRLDHPERNDHRWLVFVNSIFDNDQGRVRMLERPYVQMVPGDRYLPGKGEN
ncbi:MAG: adenylyl-sulfate reductase subunit alpha [Bacteroidota bacterium]